MSAKTGNAPAWLFSFLDLAFLLLIAVLLTAERADAPALATIDLPEIERSNTRALEPGTATQWQLLVHPPRVEDTVVERGAPFSLVVVDGDHERVGAAGFDRLSPTNLRRALSDLARAATHKPVLAPHRDSRAEDFLTALGFVQESWPEQHVAAVRPRAPMPAVSSGPVAVEHP